MSALKQAADFANKIIDSFEGKEAIHCYSRLWEASRDESLPENVRKYIKLIGDIASYHFCESNSHDPYHPIFQNANGRTATPGDLSDDDLSTLEQIIPLLYPTVVLARVCDVLWIRRRKFHFAENSLKIYLECAQKEFDLENWIFSAKYIERALRLASMLRRKKPELINSTMETLYKWIIEESSNDTKFATYRLIDLLVEFRYKDITTLFSKAALIAENAQIIYDFHRAEQYWRLAVKCARAGGDENQATHAQSQLAETYAANARIHKTSNILAAHWMQQAIEAYKAVPSSKEKREALYDELLMFQKASLAEMGQFEHKIDISELVKATVTAIEGKTVREALFALTFELVCPPDYKKLRKQAEELADKFPLSNLFDSVYLDSEGRVIARSKSTIDEPVSSVRVYKLASLEHRLVVLGYIIPAIDIIITEHSISEEDFLSIVINNQFVEPGQELLYAKGLYAGLGGDYVIAMSILIPLVENSIRYLLSALGVRTSTLNSHGIQEVLRIGALLEHEKTKKILGENIIFDLKGLLIERTYGNLRNNLTHGLMSIDAFHQTHIVYLWWLILRLCLTPYYKDWVAEHANGESV